MKETEELKGFIQYLFENYIEEDFSDVVNEYENLNK